MKQRHTPNRKPPKATKKQNIIALVFTPIVAFQIRPNYLAGGVRDDRREEEASQTKTKTETGLSYIFEAKGLLLGELAKLGAMSDRSMLLLFLAPLCIQVVPRG